MGKPGETLLRVDTTLILRRNTSTLPELGAYPTGYPSWPIGTVVIPLQVTIRTRTRTVRQPSGCHKAPRITLSWTMQTIYGGTQASIRGTMPHTGTIPMAPYQNVDMAPGHTEQPLMLAASMTSFSWARQVPRAKHQHIRPPPVLGDTTITTRLYHHQTCNHPTILSITVQAKPTSATNPRTAVRTDMVQLISHTSLPLTSKQPPNIPPATALLHPTTTLLLRHRSTLVSLLLRLHRGRMSSDTATVCHHR